MYERFGNVGRRLGAAVVCALVILWIWAASAKASTAAAESRGDVVVILEDDAARAVTARLASELDGLVVGSIP